MPALVTGATGFVGKRLVKALAGNAVHVTSRNADSARRALSGLLPEGDLTALSWDPASAPLPKEALETKAGPVDVIYHLAGEPVAEGRWTEDKKRRIYDSRIAGTRNLIAAMQQCAVRPRVLVSASAVGYYGDRGDDILDETAGDRADVDFLARVCRDWEAEAQRAEALGVRVALLRIGIVLGEGGGALGRMETPFRLGLGGPIGSGKQWMPWIHVDDVVGLALHAAADERVRGPINTVAPNPVTNREFTRAYAAALHRPAIFPIPAFALRLAFGDLADVLLGSQRAAPRVAERTGYTFRYSDLTPALRATV